MKNIQNKIIDKSQLSLVKSENPDKKIVFTNGCFDILHVGHLRCLKEIKKLGEVLVLGLNSDVSVKRLKGNSRPINNQYERAEMLAAYDFIDYIVIFEEDTPENLIRILRPDLWAKGGDWNGQNLPGNSLADELGVKLVFVPYIRGKSTTEILKHSAESEQVSLQDTKPKKIAVIGDCALDLSYFSHISDEHSAETDMNVNYVDQMFADAGGAGNLACDIAVQGGIDVDLYGFCGNDMFAEILRSKLVGSGVNCDYLVPCPNTATYVYHRIFDKNNAELPRFDIGPGNVYTDGDSLRLLDFIRKNIDSYDMIVINRQLSTGFFSETFISGLREILSSVSVPIWMNSRQPPIFSGCSYKISLETAMRISGKTAPKDCAKEIYKTYGLSDEKEGYVVVTFGEKGTLAFDGNDFYEVSGVESDGERDAIGAGNAFLAALCYKLINGEKIENALKYANAAGRASAKYLRRCGHPTPDEIKELVRKI